MIAIIAAMRAEVDEMIQLVSDVKQVCRDSITFWEARIDKQDIVIMLSGVGKGHAALATVLLIKHYQPQYIINIGTAGGLCEQEEVLDVVIGTQIVQHDYDTSALDGADGIGLYFQSAGCLLERCKAVCEHMQVRYHCGLIASGDQFISEEAQIEKLKLRYPSALCAEMEAGAIAQVCTHFQIPFVILRSLSDIAVHQNNQLTFQEYVSHAALRSAEMCLEIIRETAC